MCTAGFGRVCDSSSAATLLFRGDPVSGIFRANFERVKVDVFFVKSPSAKWTGASFLVDYLRMRDRRSSSNPCRPAERYSAEKPTLQLAYANSPFGHSVILDISILLHAT